MSVKDITTDELRTLHDKEGIIFQGAVENRRNG